MASLDMHCALYLLSERVAKTTTWARLVDTVKLHQQLVVGINHVQDFFVNDLSVVVRLMLLLGVIGAFRISMGVQDVNNVVILVTVFSYIGMVCLAAEMQEEAGEAFSTGLTYSCPWEAWQPAERRHFNLLLALTQKPSQVRFQYFGAMRLDTLSKIANAVFKYAQVLRASLGDQAVEAQTLM
ncbi:uncharacterized protein LOC117649317 [Thrips palmi]|uniref:Uncharacterized protein LOC117649317 n=1 Tax=Thrips palmi TaxID=161013 RepID=A0A6P8ZRQ9_THRPL|nr:uncharacterized protein LOC117649317 [Thrips palmi]